jgi:adenylate cyclase
VRPDGFRDDRAPAGPGTRRPRGARPYARRVGPSFSDRAIVGRRVPPEATGAALARLTVRRVVRAQLIALAGGGLAVTGFLHLLFADPAREAGLNSEAVRTQIILMTAIITVALPLAGVLLGRCLGWVREDRAPTRQERWWTVAQPLVQTAAAFAVWIVGAGMFALLAPRSGVAARIALGIVLAGLINCALLELMLARHLRPIFVLALARAPLPEWRGELLTRLMMSWLLTCAVPLLAIAVALVVLPDNELLASAHRLAALVAVGVVLGGLVMWGAGGEISGRIEEVIDAQARVESGNLDTAVAVTNIGEVGRLQYGFNTMVSGLRERRRLEDLLGRHVGLDPSIAALGRAPHLGGEGREITALFVDLGGFTAFTERHTPEEVVAELNTFFSVVIDAVHAAGGWVNTFEGDAALCIFGALHEQPDHATRALRAAGDLPERVSRLPGSPGVGVGVATGWVVVGNIGTPDRYEYTVIGDAVNVAARLSELAKREYHGVLASEETMASARRHHRVEGWLRAGTVVVRGRSQPTDVFEPVNVAVSGRA